MSVLLTTGVMTKRQRKRRVERIPLALPLVGRVDGLETIIVDVSLLGCRLEHHFPLSVGDSVRLSFEWGDDQIEFKSEVARCNFDRSSSANGGLSVYHSGLKFVEARESSGSLLRDMIRSQIEKALEEQRANARGDLPKYLDNMPLFRGMGVMTSNPKQVREIYEKSSTLLPWMRIARERGYLSCILQSGRWKQIRTRDPEQPAEGFTIWAYEDQDQVEKLMDVYKRSDEGTRKLIRMCAELSLVVDDSIPPQRFQP